MVGSKCALEPDPFPPISSALGGGLVPDGERCVSSVGGNRATGIRYPGGVLVSGNQCNREVDINHAHVSVAHARYGFLEPPRSSTYNPSGGWTCSVFWMFASEGYPRKHSASYDGTGASSNGTDPSRNRRVLPGVTRGIAVCHHVR